ncbi:MAG: helix-turn-helix domain-containing protein [Planctomycetes bacterium]|nr:helix-turn-helix domain-containing protein [Planctomycetota bacterium]
MSMFGNLVKRLRKERGMTLEQVARRISSHKGYVSGIENGKVNPPSVKFIRKFARIFSYDEKAMVRMAYVDKAPKLIKEEAHRLLDESPQGLRSSEHAVAVPLLNTLETGYPTEVDATSREPKPLVSTTLVLPRLSFQPSFAAMVCDKSMEGHEGISIPRGSLVFLEPEPKVRQGAIVFVLFDAEGRRRSFIRQILLGDNEQVILQPLNRDYPQEFVRSQDDIHALYRVVGRLELFETRPVETRV